MNWQAISSNPFFTVALPMIITFVTATWVSLHTQNKRFEDMRDSLNQRIDDLRDTMDRRFDAVDRRLDAMDRRFDAIDRRLESIEAKLDTHAQRIARLEGPALVR